MTDMATATGWRGTAAGHVAEFTDVYAMQQDFAAHVEQAFDRLTG